jgi:hypothetical protein
MPSPSQRFPTSIQRAADHGIDERADTVDRDPHEVAAAE